MTLVILGLGNDLLGDDGIGLLAADRLRSLEAPDVTVRTTTQSGLYLLEHLQGFDDAIVLDSVLGEHPGKIRELQKPDLPELLVPSAHYAGLPEALALARASGVPMPRRLRIFGVEIGVAQEIGSSPSGPVLAALPRLAAIVRAAAADWGYSLLSPSSEEVAPHA